MVIKRDFRTLAPATQAELRSVAVAMVRAGKTRVEAAAMVGVNRRFVGQWVKVAAQGGEAVLAGRPRGRRPGEQKALSAAQQEGLRYLIARGCPDQYGLSFALWTRQAVRALIARESGVWLSLPVVGRYLRAWGFTAQRPARRATERQEGAVRTWLESTYPAIAQRAKTQGCEIQWADETGLSSRANYGHGASSHATRQGGAQVRPDLLHAQPATLSRQGACLLSGPYSPLCSPISQCYVFADRVSNAKCVIASRHCAGQTDDPHLRDPRKRGVA